HSFTANVADAAGNAATQASRAVSVDTVAPTVAIGTVAGDDKVNAAEATSSLAVSGTSTAEAGQLVTVKIDGTSVGTATVLANGTWSTTVNATGLSQGAHSFTADVSEAHTNAAQQGSGVVSGVLVAPAVAI